MVLILGLAIGSFLNVCIYRIPNGESIVFPPSACGNCKTQLRPYELIPVISFLMLRGRCRTCGASIALQYPLIELANALLYVVAYHHFGLQIETVFAFVLISLMLVMAMIDLHTMTIPDGIVLFGFVTGLATAVYHVFYGNNIYYSAKPYNGFIGMLSGSLILFVIAFVTDLIYGEGGGLGFGDVKIFVPIGLFLGWQLTLLALWLAFVVGGVFGIVLLIFFKKHRKMQMPFGPFIAVGTLISIFYGKSLIYLWLFGSL
jgi:leader peptidase (prepilin peptidase)/N-methyltransferase